MERKFAAIIRNAGWEYNPGMAWQDLAMQYWDRGQNLAEASLTAGDKTSECELSRLAVDYILLANLVVGEMVQK